MRSLFTNAFLIAVGIALAFGLTFGVADEAMKGMQAETTEMGR